jgi:hypothetical protein
MACIVSFIDGRFVPSGALTETSNSASSTFDGMNSCRTER